MDARHPAFRVADIVGWVVGSVHRDVHVRLRRSQHLRQPGQRHARVRPELPFVPAAKDAGHVEGDDEQDCDAGDRGKQPVPKGVTHVPLLQQDVPLVEPDRRHARDQDGHQRLHER
eukprot:scaffold22753_cov108-Isochrysis_galbana.AAC.8